MSSKLEDLFEQCMAEANKHPLSIGSVGTVHMAIEMRRMQDKFAIGIILDGKFHIMQQLDLMRNIPMGKYRMAYFIVPEEKEEAPNLILV